MYKVTDREMKYENLNLASISILSHALTINLLCLDVCKSVCPLVSNKRQNGWTEFWLGPHIEKNFLPNFLFFIKYLKSMNKL